MNRKLILAAVLALAAAGLAAAFDPTGVLPGVLRREKFFDGRPASYWKRSLLEGDGAEARRRLGDGGAAAAPVLGELLRDAAPGQSAEARRAAAELLGRLGPDAKPALPGLVTALYDPDPGVRAAAVEAVRACAPACPEVVPYLTDLLFTGERVKALEALARFGPAAGHAVAAVQVCLRHDDAAVRRQAARTLVQMRGYALPAVLDLRECLTDPDPGVREAAAEAVGHLGGAAWICVEELARALADDHAGIRLRAATSLGQVGARAKPAVPALQALADDPSEEVRRAAAWSLQRIEPDGRPAS